MEYTDTKAAGVKVGTKSFVSFKRNKVSPLFRLFRGRRCCKARCWGSGLTHGLSRMMGNHQVRFLGEGAAAMPSPYPTPSTSATGGSSVRQKIAAEFNPLRDLGFHLHKTETAFVANQCRRLIRFSSSTIAAITSSTLGIEPNTMSDIAS